MGFTRFMFLACVAAMAASVSGFAVAGGRDNSHSDHRGWNSGYDRGHDHDRGHDYWGYDRGFGYPARRYGWEVPKHHNSGGGNSSEPTLQRLLDKQFGPGVLGASDDRLAEGTDSHWTAEPGATASLLFEFSGNAPSTVFGIYDSTSPDFRLPLFYGYAGPGSQSSLAIQTLASGGYRVTVTSNGVSESALFGSSVFGFYLRTPGDQVYFSDTALNGDHADHLRAYHAPEGSYLLAWEDLLNGGDRDFNDLVVSISGFAPGGTSPVPLPAGIWLLGSGLVGLAGLRRRGLKQLNR